VPFLYQDELIIAVLTAIIEAAIPEYWVEKTKRWQELRGNFHAVELTVFCQ
jgi:hypothetical protein